MVGEHDLIGTTCLDSTLRIASTVSGSQKTHSACGRIKLFLPKICSTRTSLQKIDNQLCHQKKLFLSLILVV